MSSILDAYNSVDRRTFSAALQGIGHHAQAHDAESAGDLIRAIRILADGERTVDGLLTELRLHRERLERQLEATPIQPPPF